MENLAIVLALLVFLDVKVQLVAPVIWILAMTEVHKILALVELPVVEDLGLRCLILILNVPTARLEEMA